MPCRLGRVFNRWQITSRRRLLTIDKPESLGCDHPILFLHESVQPLSGGLDVLETEKVLHPLDCLILSNGTRPRVRTHVIVAS